MDHNTGLMWEQGGSPEILYFHQIQEWNDNLNEKAVAGLTDWRLPTLEEAMSLIYPKLKKDGSCIDSVFCKRQKNMLTNDKVVGGSLTWLVDFSSGCCYGHQIDFSRSYVRAVRTIQPDDPI